MLRRSAHPLTHSPSCETWAPYSVLRSRFIASHSLPYKFNRNLSTEYGAQVPHKGV